MKKQIIILLALILCICLMITACSSGLSDEDMEKLFSYIDQKVDGTTGGQPTDGENGGDETHPGEDPTNGADIPAPETKPTYTVPENASTGLEYRSNGDGTCVLIGIGTCTSTDLVISPFSPAGDLVTSIGENAFAIGYKEGVLTSVIIPNSVTSIGIGAFKWNPNLRSVSIPDSVTSIGDWAFCYCESLTSITIPEGVTSIGSEMLSSCTKLTQINLPSGVTSIGDRAFAGCESLTGITIPSSVTAIGEYAFAMCYSLKTVTLPDGLTTIPAGFFNVCESLTSVTVPASVTDIGRWAFKECKELRTIQFKGTQVQWYTITKADAWDTGSNRYTVECSDNPSGSSSPAVGCTYCQGAGTMLCPDCNGTLITVEKDSEGNRYFAQCSRCTTANQQYPCSYCSGGSSSGGSSSSSYECYYCYGSGRIECIGCDGTGQVLKYYVDHNPVYGNCIACHGSGKGTCPYCGGYGQLP